MGPQSPTYKPSPPALSRRTLLCGAAGLAGGVVLAGCGTTARSVTVEVPSVPQNPPPAPVSTITPLPRTLPTQAPTVTLTMRDGAFTPRVLTVTPGTAIRVVNTGGERHALVPAEFEDHSVRSSDVGPANSVHMTAPDTPGEYRYHCFWHDWMAGEKGTIRVVVDAAEAAAANQRAEQEAAAAPTSAPTSTPSSTARSFSNSGSSTASPSSSPTSTSAYQSSLDLD